MSELKEKVVLITGASSGIGEATARWLAKRGAKVVLGARRTDRLQKLAEEIRNEGGMVEYQLLDVTDFEQMKAIVQFTINQFGRLDALVNNAGVMPLSPLDALKIEEWNLMLDVNVRGVLHGIGAVIPIMKKQNFGHIINIASVGAYTVFPNSAVYCATKFAVRAITEGLRQEMGETIRTTVISPGVTESELADTITDESAREMMESFRANPLPASGIARAIAYVLEQPAEVDVNELIVRPTGHPA
ncbi:SDR family oxidoreductase [Paenibacillus sp. FSL R7-0312]|uniref:SDR family oxidoreductase n=1 Tax=unclassified Paenibacillus TaxID=185978 RepID=UPI0004F8DECA|nr:SDR family oxidoreductase [Paenibacillus sp. FSL R5-0912]AIQ40114.1 oxidoreductase [Paenibacillus sp. FSL R5-0912]